MKTGFARWFGEYRQAPNFKKTWTKDSARAAWERLGDDDPPDAQLIEAARRYVRWLKDQNAKRASNNPEPVHHPATWLMKRCWKGFLENETEKPDGGEHAEKLARFRKEFGEFADRLVASLTAPFCAEWLARCVLSSRAPPKIEASTPFIRNWLQMNARRKLEHIFGEDLIIEVQQQGKAAA
ncbi:MAG TPA: hypothetical protein VKR31_00745 [Rhizomicrobium sp.]|nr:hypothetical protein [Rhizomicrobium sp.]